MIVEGLVTLAYLLQVNDETVESVVQEVLSINVNTITRIALCLGVSSTVVCQHASLLAGRIARPHDHVQRITDGESEEHLLLEIPIAVADDLALAVAVLRDVLVNFDEDVMVDDFASKFVELLGSGTDELVGVWLLMISN